MLRLHHLLEENSTSKFYIQYQVYRSNHMAHGLIALHALGAPADRLDRFVTKYTPKLDEAGSFELAEPETFENLKGSRKGYNTVRDHYMHLFKTEYNNNLDDLVNTEFSKLIDGLSSNAFHGTIHLGYGYFAQNPTIVCEGLALTYFSYDPIVSAPIRDSFPFEGTLSPLTVLEMAKAETSFATIVKAGRTEQNVARLGTFRSSFNALLHESGDRLVDIAEQMELGTADYREVGKKIFNIAVTTYVATKSGNDFYILHGVTGSWALLQLLPLFSEREVAKIARVFLASLIATYLTQRSPDLDPGLLENEEAGKLPWEEILGRTLAPDWEVHVFKLVQCCYAMSKICPENDNLYKTACLLIMENPYVRVNYRENEPV